MAAEYEPDPDEGEGDEEELVPEDSGEPPGLDEILEAEAEALAAELEAAEQDGVEPTVLDEIEGTVETAAEALIAMRDARQKLQEVKKDRGFGHRRHPSVPGQASRSAVCAVIAGSRDIGLGISVLVQGWLGQRAGRDQGPEPPLPLLRRPAGATVMTARRFTRRTWLQLGSPLQKLSRPTHPTRCTVCCLWIKDWSEHWTAPAIEPSVASTGLTVTLVSSELLAPGRPCSTS